MNTLTLLETAHNQDVLLMPNMSADTRHRLLNFCQWLDLTKRSWNAPDLAAYRDALLSKGLSPTSVRAHLSTIRSRYKAFLHDDALREALYAAARQRYSRPADQKALVDEFLARIENGIHQKATHVPVISIEDSSDSAHLRLTVTQANALLKRPGTHSLRGLMGTCILAVMLCTGLREAEVCNLDVDDLRHYMDGTDVLALRVREGKGGKQRLVPYGEMEWVLVLLERWFVRSGIRDGAIFRGFTKGNKRLTARRISVKWVERLLKAYPIVINGVLISAQPHDLRRTYARRLYDAGLRTEAIQQNLGHASLETTLVYIGQLDAEQRQPSEVFSFDLDTL